MTDPIETISNFFRSRFNSYWLTVPAEEAFAVVNSMPQLSGLKNDTDDELFLTGHHAFLIRLYHRAFKRIPFSSRIYGQVKVVNENECTVEISCKGSPSLYILYFAFSVAGLIFLHRYLLMRGTAQDLTWSLIFLLLIPWLCMRLKEFTDELIEGRFEKYLRNACGYLPQAPEKNG